MNLETFLEQFNLFADASDAVAKMRELVLDWAATGRLCHTGSDGWKEGELGDVIELISGQHLLAHEHNEERRGIPYLTGPSDFGEKNPIPTRWTEQPKVIAQPGDILITVKGSGVGKTNVLVDQPTAISRQLMAIRVVAADPEFVHIVVKRAAEHFQNSKTGIAIPGIGRREVLGLKLVLPPLAEQKRIVAKVDELMALCDRLEAQQREREMRHATLARASLARFADAPTPANLHFLFHKSYDIAPADLRKSILTLAVQGKLVPQDPNDEPAEEFLTLISERLGKPKAGRLFETNEQQDDSVKPFDLPPRWAWARFPELGEFGRGKSKHRPRNDRVLFADGKYPLVQTGDVARANGTIQTHTALYNDVGLAQSKIWPAGTLCITIAANIADSGILGFDACFPDSVVGFIPAEPIPSVRYFEYFMRTAKEHLEQFAPSTAQKNINLGILEEVWIPIPPLSEQRRIVAKVDELMVLVDALETQLATARTVAKKLMEAVVAELTGKDTSREREQS